MEHTFDSSASYRAFARQKLTGKWPMSILVFLVAGLMGGTGSNFSWNFNSDSILKMEETYPQFWPMVEALLPTLLAIATPILLLSLVCFVIGGAIEMGLCLYSLDMVDSRETSFSRLFACMNRIVKGLVMRILVSLAIALGFALFVVPGILLEYGLRQVPYILAENPDMGVVEAMKQSWRMMKGHKWKLFCLDISFLGWLILCVFTAGILSLWITPYMGVAQAAFYRNLRNSQSRDYIDA